MADLRQALENLVVECRDVQRYVNGEGSDDESDRFNEALKEAEAALTAGVAVPAKAEPPSAACDTPEYCSSVRRRTRADEGKHPKCAVVPPGVAFPAPTGGVREVPNA